MRQNIIEASREREWSVEVMAVAVALKNLSRYNKGRAYNVFVLQRKVDPAIYHQELFITNELFNQGNDELKEFLDCLKENFKALPNGTRFQIALLQQTHWTAIDFKKVGNIPYFFICDAANDSISHEVYTQIHLAFKGDEIAYFLQFDMYEHPTDGPKIRKIQADPQSCGQFVLMHINDMSKTDCIDALIADQRRRPKEYFLERPEEQPKLYFLDFGSVPPQLAFVFKHTQSRGIFNSLPPALHAAVVNNKGETLRTYWTKHINDQGRPGGILYKFERYREKITAFLQQHLSDALLEYLLVVRKGLWFVNKKQISGLQGRVALEGQEYYHALSQRMQTHLVPPRGRGGWMIPTAAVAAALSGLLFWYSEEIYRWFE